VGRRIDGNGPDVAVLDQGLEGSRILALVLGVLVDELAQDEEVLFEDGLAGLDRRRLVGRQAQADEQPDDAEDDDDLDKVKPRSPFRVFRPVEATAWLFV
jgi:hypothetical protein